MEESFSLKQLQHWMQGMLVHHVPVESGGIDKSVPIVDVVNCSERLNAVAHLDIYRHSYIARLRACMQTQFSALAYALGGELFTLFADQYLDACPSQTYTLNNLGEKFSAFLELTRPDAVQDQKESWPDFMIELAGFEYALSVVFDEHEKDSSATATNDSGDDLIRIAPLLRLYQHQFPICQYYLEFSQGKKPDLPFPELSFCVVTRFNYKLGLFTIKEAQYHFLLSMQQGMSVEEAKNHLVNTFNFKRIQVDAIWPEWRKNFIASGFFCL